MKWMPQAIACHLDSMPRFLRRRLLLWALVPGGGGLVINLLIPMIVTNRRIPFLSLAVYILAMLVFGAWTIRWRRHFRRRLLASRGRLCWHCGYDLSALPDDGICPECGIPYLGDVLRESWAPFANVSRRELREGAGAGAPGQPRSPA